MTALPNLRAAADAAGLQDEQGPAATVQGWNPRAAGPAGAATRHKSAPAHPAGVHFHLLAACATLVASAFMLAPTAAHATDVQLPMLEAYDEPAGELPATGTDPRVTIMIAAGASAIALGTLATLAAIASNQPRYRRRANDGC